MFLSYEAYEDRAMGFWLAEHRNHEEHEEHEDEAIGSWLLAMIKWIPSNFRQPIAFHPS